MNTASALVIAVVLPCSALAQQTTNVRIPVGARAASASHILRLNAVAPLPAHTDIVALRRGEFVATRFAAAATRHDTSATGSVDWTIPIQLTGVGADGAVLDVRPSVAVQGGGLHYRQVPGDFTGSVLLGLQSSSHPAGSHRLGRAVRMLLTASVDALSPSQVTLDHTNLPYTSVRLTTRSPSSDVIMLRIRTDLDTATDSIPVSVLRPGLRLIATPKRIAGYGLEVATLAIMADVARPRTAATVTLTSDRGKVEPIQVVLDSGGTAKATIRSAGLGRATITAQSLAFQPESETVEFVFPTAFLVASIIGGLLGGVVREGWATWQDTQRVLVWHFAAGVVLAALGGVIVAVAWAFGINLLDIKPVSGSGEAFTGLVAALGAFAGLSMVASRLGVAAERARSPKLPAAPGPE